MTGLLRRWLLMPLLAMLAVIATAGWAADRHVPAVVIVHEGTVIARQSAELLATELARQGWSSTEVPVAADQPVPDLRRESAQMLVALGARAFAPAVRQAAGRPVVGALLSHAALDELQLPASEHWSVIVLDQPADRWLNLIQTALPVRLQIGMLAGAGGQKAIRQLERRALERRMSVAVETVFAPEDVVPALERLIPRMSLLLALPDAVAHNRNTVQPLLLTTYRAGVPVVAYSESYRQAGAVLALYSTPQQIVDQVVESLIFIHDGKALPSVLAPRYFTVGVNTAVARSLGLALPSSAELAERLRALGQ